MAFNPKPFKVEIPQSELDDLKQRITSARLPLPTYETEYDGDKYGVSGKYVRESLQYWTSEYDWRKIEAKINALPNYTVDMRDNDHDFNVHFIHIPSNAPNSVPLVLLHGWPGSFLEFLDVIPLLKASTNPAFDLVIPSLPGYAFSSQPPTNRSMGAEGMASVVDKLMKGLGYESYAAQGGDLGAFVACHLARSFPACKAYHINLAIIGTDGFDVDSLDDLGKKGLERGQRFMTEGVAYADEHCQRTSTISHVLASNPVSLFAWIAEKWNSWSDESPSLDHVLDSITLYWLTRTIERCLYPYRESRAPGFDGCVKSDKPMGYSSFPMEILPRPVAIVKHARPNLAWGKDHSRGGHFAAVECPKELSQDLIECFGKIWPGR